MALPDIAYANTGHRVWHCRTFRMPIPNIAYVITGHRVAAAQAQRSIRYDCTRHRVAGRTFDRRRTSSFGWHITRSKRTCQRGRGVDLEHGNRDEDDEEHEDEAPRQQHHLPERIPDLRSARMMMMSVLGLCVRAGLE
eukprot:1910620-Rhodomonas_salina.4